MTVQTPEGAAASETTPPAEAPKPAPPAQAETDWKAEARKWEQRAKQNHEAAERLAKIEDESKTEAQRAADAQAAAERRAAEAEARALRREIALEHSLGRDDAALLDGITDEDAMRTLAARLATQSPTPATGFHVDLSGRQVETPPNQDDAARAFFGI